MIGGVESNPADSPKSVADTLAAQSAGATDETFVTVTAFIVWRQQLHSIEKLSWNVTKPPLWILLWFCKGAGLFSTPDQWANFGLYWHIPSSFTKELSIADWCDSVRWYDLYVCYFIADLRSAITVCPPRSLTVRCQQPIFTLFTYLFCRQLPSNVKVLQLHDNFSIVLYYILLLWLILTV